MTAPQALLTSAGRPSARRVLVRHAASAPIGFRTTADVAWRAADGALEIVHPFTTADISDDLVVGTLVALVRAGALRGQWEFEEAAVGLVASCSAHPGPDDDDLRWAAFYDNSLRDLLAGDAAFAPVHQRARACIRGTSVLEVGCCFGFLALQCAHHDLTVSACDISPGAVALLDAAARRRRVTVHSRVGDATALPFATDSVDTVTLIHLLEHLDADDVRIALAEALRVARRAVVVAIPYEEHPSEHFGHRTALSESDLRGWVHSVDHHGAEIFADHGGWAVLTPRSARGAASRREAQISPRLLAM